jgi:hypothetical protein
MKSGILTLYFMLYKLHAVSACGWREIIHSKLHLSTWKQRLHENERLAKTQHFNHNFFIHISLFFCPFSFIARSKSFLWTHNYLAIPDFFFKFWWWKKPLARGLRKKLSFIRCTISCVIVII